MRNATWIKDYIKSSQDEEDEENEDYEENEEYEEDEEDVENEDYEENEEYEEDEEDEERMKNIEEDYRLKIIGMMMNFKDFQVDKFWIYWETLVFAKW